MALDKNINFFLLQKEHHQILLCNGKRELWNSLNCIKYCTFFFFLERNTAKQSNSACIPGIQGEHKTIQHCHLLQYRCARCKSLACIDYPLIINNSIKRGGTPIPFITVSQMKNRGPNLCRALDLTPNTVA